MLHYPYATAMIADDRQRELREEACWARLTGRVRRARRDARRR